MYVIIKVLVYDIQGEGMQVLGENREGEAQKAMKVPLEMNSIFCGARIPETNTPPPTTHTHTH